LKSLIFNKKGITHNPVNFWILSDGIIVVIYQGSRGARPDLDFVVKYKKEGKRLRAPSHTHWIVDLLIKCQSNSSLVCEYINEWIEKYEELEPFKTVEERDEYQLIYNKEHSEKYGELNSSGDFSIEFLSSLIELFIRCEKQTPGAFMFKNLLSMMTDYCQGKKDFYQVIGQSKRV
jgi:hypothetical protein